MVETNRERSPVFEKLNIFQIAMASAQHSGARQAIVAQNIANADTPGYAARDLMPFRQVYDAAARSQHTAGALRATRARHLNGFAQGQLPQTVAEQSDINPNGNSVSVEDQMLRAVELRRQHDRSLAIYKSSLTLLRTSLGRK